MSNATLIKVLFNTTNALLSSIIENLDEGLEQRGNYETSTPFTDTDNVYRTQCFPLYSLLLAIGRTTIDYFGLDVEGSEYKILKTIPWHKVDIKTTPKFLGYKEKDFFEETTQERLDSVIE
ncbi:hypothetical protein OUZ56_011915 [Daphnia magna]|uniref:Methyltransferase FkbM domain-containing protein n=1 Tax=Daphnia magna TaxID=35525 RepID=A0ABQ9Z1H7_9CRUS|nr:hypothetical protein OUZ56_011915 [Daphnia magna]